MSPSREERSVSPDGSVSPGNIRHRPRSVSPDGSVSPGNIRHRPRSVSPDGSASPGNIRHRRKSPSPHKSASPARSPSLDRHRSASPENLRHRARSPSPDKSASPENIRHRPRSRSRSRSLPKRSHSRSPDPSNPGNNLYVTGLSTRVTSSDLEKFFGKEGKVLECSLVTDPRTKESRGFAFITMETPEDAERCIKYLNRSVLEGRLITVEKAKRARGRTPTPGRYQGIRDKRGGPGPGRGRRRSRSYSPRRRYDRESRSHDDRDPPTRDRRGRSRSPSRRRADDHYDSYRRHR